MVVFSNKTKCSEEYQKHFQNNAALVYLRTSQTEEEARKSTSNLPQYCWGKPHTMPTGNYGSKINPKRHKTEAPIDQNSQTA